jgi:subtilisin family serine protease
MKTILSSFLLFAAFISTPTPSLLADTLSKSKGNRVSAQLTQKIETGENVRVFIMFDVPKLQTISNKSSSPMSTRLSHQMNAISAVRTNVIAGLSTENFTLERQFNYINGMAMTVNADGLSELLANISVLRVDIDQGGQGHLNEGRPIATIDAVQSMGYTGEDVVVAVLDSGFDSDHPDLSDDLVAEACFCSDGGAGCCPSGGTTQFGTGAAEDDHGHGTHVSGIITSSGIVGPIGSAPDAGIVAVKVLDSANSFCCASDVTAGLDWVIGRDDVDLVNMSLGTSAGFTGDCDDVFAFTMAMSTAINTLSRKGVVAFASAGNNGSGTEMGAPACLDKVVSVGAIYDAGVDVGKVTTFSQSNSETDVFAPGSLITSSQLGGGTIDFQGTSMASPMTAGCAALLLDIDKSLSAADIKKALTGSSTQVTDPTNDLNFPLLDCADAVKKAETACYVIQASNNKVANVCL